MNGPTRKRIHIPNRVPRPNRWFYIAASIALAVYGTYGVIVDKLYVPMRGSFFILRGAPAVLVYMGMLCGCAGLLAIVADHYDRRDNEATYKRFIDRSLFTAFVLVFIGTFWALFTRDH